MKKAVFLDRDGTINVDYGYVYQYEKFEFIEGVLETLKKLQKMGYALIIVTNQSGIARGYYTEEDMHLLHKKMCEDLEKEGIQITDIYYCPHLTGCTCRKPQLELFYRATKEHDIDLSHSIAVGDKMRDLSLCENEPVLGFWITQEEQSNEAILDLRETDMETLDLESDKRTGRVIRIKSIREIPDILNASNSQAG